MFTYTIRASDFVVYSVVHTTQVFFLFLNKLAFPSFGCFCHHMQYNNKYGNFISFHFGKNKNKTKSHHRQLILSNS